MSKKLFNQTASWEEAQQHPKEQAVRRLINSGVEEFKRDIKSQDDLVVLEEGLRRETEGANRTSILKPLKAKIAKLRKEQGRLEITVDNNPEVLPHDPWQKAKNYLSAAKRFARASVACQCMLGFELAALKKELGFVQGGKQRGKSKTDNLSVFKTWEEHCQSELGISDRTARRFENMAEVAKKRLKSCFANLPLLEKPVTEYSDEQLDLLEKAVEKVTDGQTQAELLQEWRLAKAPQGSGASGGNLRNQETEEEQQEKQEPTMQQLAFALFADPVHSLCNLRTHSDYQKSLFALPVISGDPEEVSLTTMEQAAESFLADIREAKEAAMKQAQTA